MGSPSDAEIITRSLTEPPLFEYIFSRHYQVVRMYAQRRAGLDHGEEVAAATFEQAFIARHRFDADRHASARPWLIGIANNLLLRHSRHQGIRQRHWPLSISLARDEPEMSLDAIEAEEQRPLLRAALARLAERDRETFLLVVLGELSYSEVAAVLNIPVGTVRSRVNRVRRLLRELLEATEAITTEGRERGAPGE